MLIVHAKPLASFGEIASTHDEHPRRCAMLPVALALRAALAQGVATAIDRTTP